jgi:hypothetical protein
MLFHSEALASVKVQRLRAAATHDKKRENVIRANVCFPPIADIPPLRHP